MNILISVLLLVFSTLAIGENKMEEDRFSVEIPQNGAMAGISKWKQYYFLGITKGELESINLNYQQFSGLLHMIGVDSYIATGLAIDPAFAVNRNQATIGTPWLNMYAVLAHYQPEVIDVAYQGNNSVFLPEEWSRGLFPQESGWPKPMIQRHDSDLNGYKMFILPFLIPDHTDKLVDLRQSMKAPDGSLEIFWFSYFDVENPERLLIDTSSLKNFILEERQELIVP